MSPCNDFITYFFVDIMCIFAFLLLVHPIRDFIAQAINQSERGKSIKYVITWGTVLLDIILYLANVYKNVGMNP